MSMCACLHERIYVLSFAKLTTKIETLGISVEADASLDVHVYTQIHIQHPPIRTDTRAQTIFSTNMISPQSHLLVTFQRPLKLFVDAPSWGLHCGEPRNENKKSARKWRIITFL